jgi:putative endonuclease
MQGVDRPGFVYIMASARNGTLYIGVTSQLVQRIWQHRDGVVEGFTRKYGCRTLVWYQDCGSIEAARTTELQMKKWRRGWKLRVIEASNPDWEDLFPTLT